VEQYGGLPNQDKTKTNVNTPLRKSSAQIKNSEYDTMPILQAQPKTNPYDGLPIIPAVTINGYNGLPVIQQQTVTTVNGLPVTKQQPTPTINGYNGLPVTKQQPVTTINGYNGLPVTQRVNPESNLISQKTSDKVSQYAPFHVKQNPCDNNLHMIQPSGSAKLHPYGGLPEQSNCQQKTSSATNANHLQYALASFGPQSAVVDKSLYLSTESMDDIAKDYYNNML